MADVFSSIAPDFDELIQRLGDDLITGFKQGVSSATTNRMANTLSTALHQSAQDVLRRYIELLADHHNDDIEPSAGNTLTRGISHDENWLDSVDGYRPVFAEVTRRVDDFLQVETPSEVAYDLRVQVMHQLSLKNTVDPSGSTAPGVSPEARCERFLDSEVIAIYW